MFVDKLKKIIVEVLGEWRLFATVLVFLSLPLLLAPNITGATLSCSVTSTCVMPNVALMNIASTTNSHVSIGTSTDYNTNIVCCGGVSNLTSTCSGTGVITRILGLSSTTNAHIESSSLANYPVQACLRVNTGGYASSTVQTTDCTGYETTVGSMTSTTNSHMGAAADYTYKICASAAAPPQSLSFSLSTTSIGFGTLSATQARFATDDGAGTYTEASYQSMTVSTNAQYGFLVSVKGATLSSGTTTITAIGGTATDSSAGIGTNQFGLRVSYSGGDVSGSGTVLSPYDSGYGYAADATTTSAIIHKSAGPGTYENIDYSMSYLANIAPSLKPGTYTTVLTYVVTAEY